MKKLGIKPLDFIFVILFIIFIVLVLSYKTSNINSADIDKGEMRIIKLRVDELENYSTEMIKTGDICKDFKRNTIIGKVVDFKVATAIDNPENEFKGIDDGRKSKEAYSSLTIDVESKAEVRSDGIYISGFRYLLGESVIVRCGDTQLFVKILALE